MKDRGREVLDALGVIMFIMFVIWVGNECPL